MSPWWLLLSPVVGYLTIVLFASMMDWWEEHQETTWLALIIIFSTTMIGMLVITIISLFINSAGRR